MQPDPVVNRCALAASHRMSSPAKQNIVRKANGPRDMSSPHASQHTREVEQQHTSGFSAALNESPPTPYPRPEQELIPGAAGQEAVLTRSENKHTEVCCSFKNGYLGTSYCLVKTLPDVLYWGGGALPLPLLVLSSASSSAAEGHNSVSGVQKRFLVAAESTVESGVVSQV